MVARSTPSPAPVRDYELRRRLEVTARQKGCLAFCVNREGYAIIKDEVAPAVVVRPPGVGTLHGIAVLLLPRQKKRALAFWDFRSLRKHVGEFS